MSCENYKKRLEACAAGVLDEKGQRDVHEHCLSCGDCRSELAGLQRAALMLEKAFDEEAPSWLMQKTMAGLRAQPKRSFSWFAWGLPALAGAAAVMLLLAIGPELNNRFGWSSNHTRLSGAGQKPGMENNPAAPDSKASAAAAISMVSASHVNLSDELNVNLENPINDRSIYEDLGIARKVANLLL